MDKKLNVAISPATDKLNNCCISSLTRHRQQSQWKNISQIIINTLLYRSRFEKVSNGNQEWSAQKSSCVCSNFWKRLEIHDRCMTDLKFKKPCCISLRDTHNHQLRFHFLKQVTQFPFYDTELPLWAAQCHEWGNMTWNPLLKRERTPFRGLISRLCASEDLAEIFWPIQNLRKSDINISLSLQQLTVPTWWKPKNTWFLPRITAIDLYHNLVSCMKFYYPYKLFPLRFDCVWTTMCFFANVNITYSNDTKDQGYYTSRVTWVKVRSHYTSVLRLLAPSPLHFNWNRHGLGADMFSTLHHSFC